MADREALMARLLATFTLEAAEHVAALAGCFLDLEKAGPQQGASIVEVAFREAHSLKGAARSVNRTDVESICQSLESVLSDMKRGSLLPSAQLLDVLFRAVRALEQLQLPAGPARGLSQSGLTAILGALKEQRQAGATPAKALQSQESDSTETAALPSVIRNAEPASPSPRGPSDQAESEYATGALATSGTAKGVPAELDRSKVEVVRLSTHKLDAVRLHAEQLLSDKLGFAQVADELEGVLSSLSVFRKRARRARLASNALVRTVASSDMQNRWRDRQSEQSEQERAFLEGLEQELAQLARRTRQHQRSLASRVDALLADSIELLMLPCSSVLDGLRYVVRDLSHSQGKEAVLVLQGESVEIDRRILSELKDPLLHLIRNSVDHGIEAPEERRQAGKREQGAISIQVTPMHGNRVEIRIADDGRGVNARSVTASAIDHGFISELRAEELGEQAAFALAFESAVSTSSVVSELSGRGLGLAIVREKVEQLGGTAELESQLGKGTTVILALPVSLATFRGISVKLGDRSFVAPTVDVELATRVKPSELRSVENRAAVFLRGETLGLVHLADALGLPRSRALSPEAPLQVLVLRAGATRLAFVVDEVCREQEVLVKGLGPHLSGLPRIHGATVLSSGEIVPVLDVPGIIRSTLERGPALSRLQASAETGSSPGPRSVLVAEDSITSRTLLKGILESANFSVTTAVDGLDAWNKLRTGQFDLVISDVDMPRLSGFGLTQKIRADRKLNELPVILVTSLDSVEDRERGIDAGANAYIVKRSFEQSDLLEVIGKIL